MPVRTVNAEWHGDLVKRSGHMRLGSGAFEGSYALRSRMGDAPGTNPEEQIGAAHAGCFSMALAHELAQAGFTVARIRTAAKVHFSLDTARGWSIPLIDSLLKQTYPASRSEAFAEHAQRAKGKLSGIESAGVHRYSSHSHAGARHSNGAEREL